MTTASGVRHRFNDLSIRVKILAVVTLTALVAVLLSGLALVRVSDLNDELHLLSTQNVTRLGALADIRGSQSQLNGAVIGLFVPGSTEETVAKAVSDSVEAAAAEDERMDAYQALAAGTSSEAEFGRLFATWKLFYNGLRVNVLQLPPLAGIDVPRAEQLAAFVAQMDTRFSTLTDAEQAAAAATAADGEAAYHAAVLQIVIALTVALLVVLVISLRIVAGIVRPIHLVSDALDALARGDLRVRADVDGDNETGRMARALRAAQESLRSAMSVISSSSQALAANSEDLRSISDEVSRNAEHTSSRSGEAASAADEVSRNVQTVAEATEEMGSSIREISSSSTDALRVAAAAVDEATQATRTVAKLGDSSTQIGNVIKTITSIAEQTNLLALNATIEAARAGEAGKGFAVVASEVKELAQETARATDDISGRVEAIQLDVEAAVEVIARISQIIEDVNAFQTTIASAVQEQSASGEQIRQNVIGAAAGSRAIASNIEEVAGAARASNAGIERAKRASDELGGLAGRLQQVVAGFSV